MDDAHLTVIDLVGHRSTTGAEHTTVEITVVHAEHHATHILVVVFALPFAGIGTLVDKRLKNVIGLAQRTPPGLHIRRYRIPVCSRKSVPPALQPYT